MKTEVRLFKGELQSIIDSISMELELIEIIPSLLTNTKNIEKRYNDLVALRDKLEDYIV